MVEAPKVAPAEPVKARGSMVERFEFAKAILRERPHITSHGADGLSALVEREFGCGMAYETIAKLREQVAKERAEEEAAIVAVGTPRSTPVQANAAPVPAVQEASIALQLAQAIEAESTAKVRKVRAQAELEAAQVVLDGATAQVEKLLAQMQSQRA